MTHVWSIHVANTFERFQIVRIRLGRDASRVVEPRRFQLLDVREGGIKNEVHATVFPVGPLHLDACGLKVRSEVQIRSTKLGRLLFQLRGRHVVLI